MDFLRYLFGRSWRLLLSATLASLIGGASGVALIGLMTKDHHDPIHQVAALFLGTCFLHFAARTVSQVLLLNLTQSSVLDIRLDLSRKLLATRIETLNQLGKSELLAMLTRDIESLIAAMTIIPLIMTHVAVLLGCMAYMAWLAWKMFLLFVVALGAGMFAFHRLKYAPLLQLRSLREQMGRLYGHFRDLVEGSRELQLNARRGQIFIDEVLRPDAAEFKRSYVSTYSRWALITNFGDVLFYFVIGELLFVAPLMFDYDHSVFTAFAMILLYLMVPLSSSMNAMPVIAQGRVAFRQLGQLGASLADSQQQLPQSNPFATDKPLTLELTRVCHYYPGNSADDRFMLGPLDLRLGAGEILFIIGGNGSGKTTLAMLLLGLYLPEQGTLRLNGVAVDKNNVHHYRSHFSAVFADFHLFRHLLLDTEENDIRAAYYLNKLGLGSKVEIVNGMFSTISLSSGQRKRLALVSAYLEDRPVYLFDEWAADQDPVFKKVFYCELLPELRARGKTVIVISHDDAYFAQADRIIRLQDGHLIPFIHNEDRDSTAAALSHG